MKLKLILSYDHELPLGELTSSFSDALFNPTNKVLEIANRNNIPVTLFTDILCAKMYKQWDFQNFYVPYQNQIVNALENNHDVQLHIHPHWLTSSYENNSVLPSKDFALSDFINNGEWSIEKIIKLGISELQSIFEKNNINHKIVAYRAGGYNIEYFSEQIFSALIDNGIHFDSSVVPGYYFVSDVSKIDFRKTPKLNSWKIDKSGNFRVNAYSGITELPITTIKKTIFEIPTKFKLKKYSFRAPVNRGKMIHSNNSLSFGDRLKTLMSHRLLSFDNHTYSINYLLKIVNHNVKKFRNSDEIIITSCSHPKTMGKYAFELMEEFIYKIKKQYPEAEFTSFSKLHKQNH